VPAVRAPIQLMAPIITLLVLVRMKGMENESIRRKRGGSFGFARLSVFPTGFGR
jgi:hypothetical protein